MITLHLVGIGTGNPDHLTLAAINALNRADLILLPLKGDEKSDLADLRRLICDRFVTGPARIVPFDLPVRRADGDYLGAVDDWHAEIAEHWAAVIDRHLPPGGADVALLVWGDPSLYDSSLRIVARLQARGLAIRSKVVPGITSLQVLTAEHAIPLNDLAGAVQITTGRRLRAEGWPVGVCSVAVMLDSGGAFDTLPPDGVHIWWGAYLGMSQQCLIKGPLMEVGPRILETRAGLRAQYGWIMDIYLMRRGKGC